MASSTTHTIAGTHGSISVHSWPTSTEPTWLAVLVHGYGEHLGRYDHVAAHLTDNGAQVVGPDHLGHGRSEGERVLVEDLDDVVDDLHRVVEEARDGSPTLPVVMIGHSLGGLVATRYAQRLGAGLAALVLSGPVLGSWGPTALADLPEIPETPIDPATLSRDPAVGEAYVADELVWHGSFRRETLQALSTLFGRIAAGPDLGTLPTLWMHGSDDQLVPIGPTRAGIEQVGGQDLTEVVWPGARHEIFNETNRAEVLATVTSFVLDHLPAPAEEPPVEDPADAPNPYSAASDIGP